MRATLFLLAFLAVPALAAQVVWKWVDERGVTHYSDRAVPGATRVEIASGSRSDAGTAPSFSSSRESSTSSEDSAPGYRNFEIWKPSAGETIANTGGQVSINIRVEPDLHAGHSLHLYFNGRLVEGFPPNTFSYDLKEVPRGSHRVIAVINDERGVRVQEAAPVSFIVRQQSVAQPPVGPSLRPPPKKN